MMCSPESLGRQAPLDGLQRHLICRVGNLAPTARHKERREQDGDPGVPFRVPKYLVRITRNRQLTAKEKAANKLSVRGCAFYGREPSVCQLAAQRKEEQVFRCWKIGAQCVLLTPCVEIILQLQLFK